MAECDQQWKRCQTPLPAFHVAVNDASTCPWFCWVRWCHAGFFLGYFSTDVHTRFWETWELRAVISHREDDWVTTAQNVLVVSLRLNNIFTLGYPVAYGERVLGSQLVVAWSGDLSSCTPVWGVPLTAAVLKWQQEVAPNPGRGARGHASASCPFLTWTTARGPLGWALDRCRQRCWAVTTARAAWAAVPHLLRGKEAPGQAETSCRLGLACRPQLSLLS